MKEFKTSEENRRKARERMRQKRRANGVKERKIKTLEERLWDRVSVDKNTGCLLWGGHCGHAGHGQIGANGKVLRVHRVSWEINNGPIPDGLNVLHKCDTPNCVNPNHLFLGSQKDNMADMKAKNRSTKGIKHGNSKLTDDVVRRIRKDRRRLVEIASDYGIAISTASQVRSGQGWSHVD